MTRINGRPREHSFVNHFSCLRGKFPRGGRKSGRYMYVYLLMYFPLGLVGV